MFVFTLSGETTLQADGSGGPYNTFASLRVDDDGNMYEAGANNGGPLNYTQIDTGTDWVRPTDDPTIYYMRYTNLVGTLSASPGTENTAIAMTANRIFTFNKTNSGIESVTFDLEILDTDQSTVLAGPTGYTLTIENTS